MDKKSKKAACYDQKFGHNFEVVGGKCGKCGVGQDELDGKLRKIEYFVKKPERGIHSEAHALAKEISEYCGEPRRFGMYLGIIKNIGLPRAYQVFAELKQGKEIKTPGKLFLYLSAYKKVSNGKIKRKTKPTRDGNRKRAGKDTPEKTKKRRKNNAGN